MSGRLAPGRGRGEAPPPEASSVSLSLWLRLIKAYNLVLREVRGRLDPSLTLPRFDVLSQLARDPAGATPAALSRRLLVSAGNMTGIVDRLVREGLVRRDVDSTDRRKIRLRLTAPGRALVRRMQPRHARDLETILSPVPIAHQRALREMLGRFVVTMERRENSE